MPLNSQTINGIIYQTFETIKATEIKRLASITGLTRFSRYNIGEKVQFVFNGLIRYGQITNVINRAGIFSYNIDTGHTWYRDVDEEQINGLYMEAKAIPTISN